MRTSKKVHVKYWNEKDNRGWLKRPTGEKGRCPLQTKQDILWLEKMTGVKKLRGVYIYIWHNPGVTHEHLSQSPNKEAEKIVFVMVQILDKYE